MIQSLKLNNVKVKYLPTSQVGINWNIASLEKTHSSVLVFHHRLVRIGIHAAGQSRPQLKLILPVGRIAVGLA